MLLLSPAFADSSFAQVALDGSFEGLLRHGNKYPGIVVSRIPADKVSHARDASMLSFLKKIGDDRLAVKPFLFW